MPVEFSAETGFLEDFLVLQLIGVLALYLLKVNGKSIEYTTPTHCYFTQNE